jgi:hypothetical protein
VVWLKRLLVVEEPIAFGNPGRSGLIGKASGPVKVRRVDVEFGTEFNPVNYFYLGVVNANAEKVWAGRQEHLFDPADDFSSLLAWRERAEHLGGLDPQHAASIQGVEYDAKTWRPNRLRAGELQLKLEGIPQPHGWSWDSLPIQNPNRNNPGFP